MDWKLVLSVICWPIGVLSAISLLVTVVNMVRYEGSAEQIIHEIRGTRITYTPWKPALVLLICAAIIAGIW